MSPGSTLDAQLPTKPKKVNRIILLMLKSYLRFYFLNRLCLWILILMVTTASFRKYILFDILGVKEYPLKSVFIPTSKSRV